MWGNRARLFALLLAAAFVTGCGKEEKTSLVDRAQLQQAEELQAALDDAAFDKSVEEALEIRRRELAALAFPILRAAGKCDESVLEVMYDPYRDLMRLTLHKPNALDEQLRWISLDGKRVFEEAKPFVRPDQLPKAGTMARPRIELAKLTENHAKLFPPAKDVELAFEAETMAAMATGDKFRYSPFVHGGWKVKLHVFSPKMVSAIEQHAKQAKRAGAELYVLETLLGKTVDQIRGSKLEAVSKALGRYDERHASVKKRSKELESIPHDDKKASLRIEHDPPCK